MRFLDFNLRPKKMTLKAQIFPDFLTSEGDRFPTFGGIFSDLRWKSKNRIGNAYSIVLRSRKIPHMTKSVHWFGCRLWCYRFKSLHILYFRLFVIGVHPNTHGNTQGRILMLQGPRLTQGAGPPSSTVPF